MQSVTKDASIGAGTGAESGAKAGGADEDDSAVACAKKPQYVPKARGLVGCLIERSAWCAARANLHNAKQRKFLAGVFSELPC